MKKYILEFSEIGVDDIAVVGSKNASLAAMYNNLIPLGINIPNGFAITINAYKDFINYNNLQPSLGQLMDLLDKTKFTNLKEIGLKARNLLLNAKFPLELQTDISSSYTSLFGDKDLAVAVRSTAIAEDFPNASFTGLHDSFLNIKRAMPLIYAVKCCFASFYTDSAIKYREDLGFDHDNVFLSIGIQHMVRSDLACSGIGFTIEHETGIRDIIHISGTWGLKGIIVESPIISDAFFVFKSALKNNEKVIIQKKLGSKTKMFVYNDNLIDINSTVIKMTPRKWCERFILEDSEIEKLARWALVIESYYNKPIAFEWAKDGLTGELYIVQAKPENGSSGTIKI